MLCIAISSSTLGTDGCCEEALTHQTSVFQHHHPTTPCPEPNARCCCPRCNSGKGQNSLADHEAHLILQLTTLQCPTWRAANGLSPKPMPLPLCFYTIPATESEEEA
jgi:hypothetical protein